MEWLPPFFTSAVPTASSAPSWSPADATSANLVCWLRGDRGITVDVDTNVSMWADQSGSGNNFSQAVDVLRPPFTASGTCGGKPCVHFDNIALTPRYLENASISPSGLTAVEGWCIFRRASQPTGADFALWALGTTAQGNGVPYINDLIYEDAGTAVRENAIPYVGDTYTHARAYYFISTAATHEVGFEGTPITSRGTNTFALPTLCVLGASEFPANVYTLYLNGDIAEFILYDGELDVDDTTDLLDYIETRNYGVVV